MRKSSEQADARRAQDHRNGTRYTLILRIGVIEQAGKCSLCFVKNISSAGLQLKCYAPPIVDAEATVRVADEAPVGGRIVWVKGDVAGMSFCEKLDAAALLRVRQKLRPNRRRNMPRVNVEASATLRTGGRTCRALVCDISSLGARVRTNSPLREGDRAVVAFAGLPSLNAFVRWNDGQESGLIFESPIPMEVIAGWIEHRARSSG